MACNPVREVRNVFRKTTSGLAGLVEAHVAVADLRKTEVRVVLRSLRRNLLVIFGIALLVFGPKKLAELSKGIGEGIRGFKSAIKADENTPADTTTRAIEDRTAKG